MIFKFLFQELFGLSLLLNVAWCPVAWATKIWFFQWAAIWWFGFGLVSAVIAFALYDSMRGDGVFAGIVKFLTAVVTGPCILVGIIQDVFSR